MELLKERIGPYMTKEIPKEFWAEAVQCAVYIQNRCSHAILENKTPQKL
jgi:hypothetical protein